MVEAFVRQKPPAYFLECMFTTRLADYALRQLHPQHTRRSPVGT